MTGHLQDSVQAKLSHLDEQIQQRDLRVTLGYSLGLAGSIALYLYFPFPMSRIGSVVLMVALAHMIWQVYAARRDAAPTEPSDACPALAQLNAQIRLVQSMIYNLPFVVGANLFFMGLPGTGSEVSKAWLNCYFLLATVILFGIFYLANQQIVRKELLPLRAELEQFLRQNNSPLA